jgi:glycosyltransferase involved in cell wall biosynthesis
MFIRYLEVAAESDLVICNSLSTQSEFDSFFNARISVEKHKPRTVVCELPITLDTDNFKVHESSGESGSLPSILCVGTIEPRKRSLQVLEASIKLWEQGNSFRLTFVGKVHPIVHKRFLELANQAPPGCLMHYEDLSDEELITAYQVSLFTVFISIYEGFGLPAHESLKAGRPVIVSDSIANLEALQNVGAMVIRADDTKALIEAMTSLLDNSIFRDELTTKTGKYFAKSENQFNEELLDILGKI